jgi:hypothetical protein
MADPYKPPSAPIDAPVPGGSEGRAQCPKCGMTRPLKVGFTWWGGVVGPALFHVVRCDNCGKQYNGKTGLPLTSTILVYQLVGFGLVAVLTVVYYALRR